MPTMLTSWGKAIFTQGWASIIAAQRHRQPAGEQGKVWPVSHHNPISGLAYLKHLTSWPPQHHRSQYRTRPTAWVKHLHHDNWHSCTHPYVHFLWACTCIFVPREPWLGGVQWLKCGQEGWVGRWCHLGSLSWHTAPEWHHLDTQTK